MRTLRSLLLATCCALPVAAQQALTTPQQALGHQIGADYFLPTYIQLQRWWEQLARQSNRMKLDTIGLTAEGRPQLMAILSSPANLARLEEYRKTSETLARGRVDSATARRLAQTGKSVVWIDGGLHADEVLGANQLLELVWQMVSMNDPETLRILDDDIILAVQVNPDGMELVANWYMRNADSLRRSTGGLPRLYEKYAGHDDNRDWYRAALPETQNGERVQYHVWYPQIIYNHHQTGPTGSVMFTPPFRDPFNYFFDPMIPSSIDWVGMAMQRRFAAEGKPGIVDKNSTSYSTWWNGGLRTAGYFHNMIGILTEAIGNPTPQTIQLVLDRQLPSGDGIYPVQWGPWHFRQSIDYSMTANRAILDLASKYREDLLFNFWRMGRNSIDRGSSDTWTTTPVTIAAAQKAIGGAARRRRGQAPTRRRGCRRRRSRRSRRWLHRAQPVGVRVDPARPDAARSARIRHSRQSAGVGASTRFSPGPVVRGNRDQQVDCRLQHQGRELSEGIIRRPVRPGVPAARARHVRTTVAPDGPAVSGWSAQATVRQCRLHAGIPDGFQVRSHSRRAAGHGAAGAGHAGEDCARPGTIHGQEQWLGAVAGLE